MKKSFITLEAGVDSATTTHMPPDKSVIKKLFSYFS